MKWNNGLPLKFKKGDNITRCYEQSSIFRANKQHKTLQERGSKEDDTLFSDENKQFYNELIEEPNKVSN